MCATRRLVPKLHFDELDITETKEYYQLSPEIESEATKLKSKKKFGKEIVVVSANNYATSIAKDILIKGGSAADAAVIIQLVLGLVEPQSSGIREAGTQSRLSPARPLSGLR